VHVPEQEGPLALVSWIAADRSGLIYLIQRNDKLDPVIVVDRNGKVVRSWGKGMYKTPHAIRVAPGKRLDHGRREFDGLQVFS
jgi:hypothetical protein